MFTPARAFLTTWCKAAPPRHLYSLTLLCHHSTHQNPDTQLSHCLSSWLDREPFVGGAHHCAPVLAQDRYLPHTWLAAWQISIASYLHLTFAPDLFLSHMTQGKMNHPQLRGISQLVYVDPGGACPDCNCLGVATGPSCDWPVTDAEI